MSELTHDIYQASYIPPVSSYAGAVILRGRDYALPILESMALAVRLASESDTMNLVLREKVKGNMSIALSNPGSIEGMTHVHALDHFCIGAGPDFDQPLLVPSMRKEIREAITGYPNFEDFAPSEIGTNPANRLCKLLANLSQLSNSPDTESQPFAQKVHSLIFSRIKGSFSAGLFLNGAKANIILADKNSGEPPSVGLLITKNCVALTWYSSSAICQEFGHTIRMLDDDPSIQPILIPLNRIENSVIVIHPQFLVSKWMKAKGQNTGQGARNPFLPLNVISKYIFNLTIPL